MPALREMLRTAQEARANDWSQYRALLESITTEPTAEQAEQLERMDNALQARTAELERLERAVEFERLDTTPRSEPDPPADGGGDGPELRDAFARYIRTGDPSGLERRALAVGTDSAGGYAVPDGFRARIVEKMKAFGGVRDVAEVITTDGGGNLEWPTFDGTAQEGEIVAENVQVSELDPALGINALDAYLYSSKLVRVPIQLTQDNAVNLEGKLEEWLATRVARITNKHYTIGTGTGQPDGIAVSPTTGVTAASTTAITADEIINLVHSVDPAYRSSGARFMMHDNTLAAIRKLKDSQNRYLWEPSMQAGVADSLFGYPITINQHMDASLAATDVAVLFGDFRAGYVIRDVRSFELMILKERYADYHQWGFLGFLRTDGTKSDTSAYKALVMAAA